MIFGDPDKASGIELTLIGYASAGTAQVVVTCRVLWLSAAAPSLCRVVFLENDKKDLQTLLVASTSQDA